VTPAARGPHGLQIADPLIGLAITLVILRITWHSWQTVRAGEHERGDAGHHDPAHAHDHA
jgi:hypothetical protein